MNRQQKIIVITGASSGIGRASARLLADQGYTVYDLSRSEKPQPDVIHVACDVTDKASVGTAIRTVFERERRIDILILCAGMGIAGAIEFTREDEMQRQFDVNTWGSIRVVQAALGGMRQQPVVGGERGRIVFVSSMAGHYAIPFQAMYSASKAAINSFAFALRNELRSHQIPVSCVMPGDVHTAFKRTTDLTGLDVYPQMEKAIRQMEHDEANGLSSEQVARRIVRVATTRTPRLYYTSDRLSDLLRFLSRLFTSDFATRVVSWMYHCG
ncbi:MAG: SDR family NAD(P)-dependent oxidoreductase [Parabacteroides sp.]